MPANAAPELSLRAADIVRTRLAALPWALLAGVALCVGIAISALTTVDHDWWVLYFSQLGTFGDASSFVFNAGLVLCGALIAFSSVVVRAAIEDGLARGVLTDTRARHVLPLTLVVMGVSLAMIGIVPVSSNEFLHDRAANGAVLSFAALVFSVRKLTPQLPARLHRWALIGVAALVIGITAMFLGYINLTAFEVLAFGTILGWVQVAQTGIMRLTLLSPAPSIDGGADVAAEPGMTRDTDAALAPLAEAGPRISTERLAMAQHRTAMPVTHLAARGGRPGAGRRPARGPSPRRTRTARDARARSIRTLA